ncbi:growth/differentiation factor 10b isoform X3 [Oreochromis niloticus]|uniref:growth/differentiation factor 10b isoform X3 n=1 Tax=Oreochromis niloticus TaxID=8128 RepID=UPI000905BA54|nr:interferon gamma receptor 1-like isoform X3 [Oreochromis niloticus]
MDSFHAVFLYFSCMTVVASRVLPPMNVTLHCRNFHNVLKWSYPEDTTGLSFRLNIGAYQNPPDIRTWNTSALQADLSFLSDPNDSYYVAVTAVVNGSESEPAPSEDGITFSYFHENPVETKCYLDLPPVNVTAQRDNKVQISFVNPSVFYCEKMKKNKKKCLKDNGSKDSSFKVKILNQTHSFTCEERVCENTLPVDAAQPEHCVNITGQTSQGTLVKAKQLYCAKPFHEPSQSNFTAVYVVSAILAVATFGVILFMAYQKLTKPTNSIIKIWFPKSLSRPMNTPESVTVDHVECSKRVSHNGDMSNVMEEEQPNGEGPGYMVGNTDLHEDPDSGDENPGSGYEKRDTVAVELGPDELAKGYRGPVAPE